LYDRQQKGSLKGGSESVNALNPGDYRPSKRPFRALNWRTKRGQTGLPPAVHRCCGQHCGQTRRTAPNAARLLAMVRFATKFSRDLLFRINGLRFVYRIMTAAAAITGRLARIVEFRATGSGDT
jgi:hypothetical protein